MTTRPLSLLYVDDDDDIRTIAVLALGLDRHMVVRPAADAQQAVALIDGGFVPDAIILDVMMPGIDGPTLLLQLRARADVGTTPVIFMTAKGRQADLTFYRARGAAGVILKPFDPVQLAQRIRAILDAGDGAAAFPAEG